VALCHPSAARVKVCKVAFVEFQSGVVTSTSWLASAGMVFGDADSTVENDVAVTASSSAQPGHALRPATRLRKSGRIILESFWLHQGLSMFWMRS
jgi:hypothetical protein